MHHAYITNNDGDTLRTVKNLGWLLRNWQRVERFTVQPVGEPTGLWQAHLTAHLRDGREYHTDFASAEQLADWLNRPVFRGLYVNCFGFAITIENNDTYRRFATAQGRV